MESDPTVVIPRLERIINDLEQKVLPRVRRCTWALVGIVALLLASLWVASRVGSHTGHSIDKLELATKRNADNIDRLSALTSRLSDDERALLASLRDLDKFLRDVVATSGQQRQGTAEAVAAIARIEHRLCGGPCPSP